MNIVDYYEIGQRIRNTHKLSQEWFAETDWNLHLHTSHIKTGNTKASPPFLDIVKTLDVQTDSLLYAKPLNGITIAMRAIVVIVEEFDTRQNYVIPDTVKVIKHPFGKYMNV